MCNEFHEVNITKNGVLIIAQDTEFIKKLKEELEKLGVNIDIIHESLCG